MSGVLRRMNWSAMSGAEREDLCRRGLDAIFEPALRSSIGALIEDVRVRGDEAVCEALARHDGIELDPGRLRVSDEEISSARVEEHVEDAIIDAISHLRAFNDHLLERASDWQMEIENGLVAGEKVTPISSAGLFVPSGKASYPSVAYQLGVPAVMAGVPTVAMVVPPVPGGRGEVDPAVLTVCRLLGITNVFRANGPAGVAALGFGTQTFPRVRKIVGPGSPAVTVAQVEMQRHGVATMMLLGPTESLVLTDHTADPLRLAADLLIEAEHGTDSTVVLVTPSPEIIDLVDAELERQMTDLPANRAEAARASLGTNGGAVLVENMNMAVDVANLWAPEHLQLVVDSRYEEAVVDALVNAGEILIGQDTPFCAGNFLIGCPASLPTSGFAHVSSGITVEAFLKRTAVAKANEAALRRMTGSILSLADHEGFPAHGNALRRRFG